MNKYSKKPNVIVIVGPTAVGKTKLSIDLAKALDSEIISADSMQVYKYMNIGTAKPTIDEMDGIKHYLIDEIEPDINFSVAQYKELAEKYIELILSKQKIPIIIGGTGLYINSLLYNIHYSETICDQNYRNELMKIAKEKGNEYLHRMLNEVDPDSAQKLHYNDINRVVRALEVYKHTNYTISYHQSQSKLNPVRYNFIVIGLTMNREILYKRINTRVDIMLQQGLIEEVKSLLKKGYTKGMTSMQAIGYKEIINFLEGEYSLDTAVEIIKRESRRYAKRQFTWFRRNKEIEWFDIYNNNYKNFFKKVYEYVAQKMEIM